MYKQQKFLNVSSTIWALIVTAIVLLIAASANAQTTDGENVESVQPINDMGDIAPLPERRPTNDATTTDGSQPQLNSLPVTSELRPFSTSTERSATTTANNASDPTAAMIQERRAAIAARQAALQEKRVALQNTTSAREAVLEEALRNRITSGASQLAVVLNRAIVTQKSINVRLQAKAAELQERGHDTTAVLTNLSHADELLTLAEEALAGIETNARYAAGSDTPRDDWTSVREQVAEVRELLREAREMIRNALSMLRAQLRPSA